MNYTKPIYFSFYIAAFVSLLVAIFLEKIHLLFVYPFSFTTIGIIYYVEKKVYINILFILALMVGLAGGVLIILGLKECIPEVSICISLFYLLYIRLMYVKNIQKKTTVRMYFTLLLVVLPVLYIYDRVVCLVYEKIRGELIYFLMMVFCMLGYLIMTIYYYIRNKNQSNLWMLIAAINLGVMNIIITINELYMYERMFTVIAVFCSNLMLFFSLKFMLEDDKDVLEYIMVE